MSFPPLWRGFPLCLLVFLDGEEPNNRSFQKLNYLTDAYEIYAASANAAASCSRSLLATVLPFASAPMFARLGIAGACSLLGGLSCVMCAIPFVFIWKGERLRELSGFCRALREARERVAREKERDAAGGVTRDAAGSAQLMEKVMDGDKSAA